MKALRSEPTVSSLELPWVNGPYTLPAPGSTPPRALRATARRGYCSSVSRRYV